LVLGATGTVESESIKSQRHLPTLNVTSHDNAGWSESLKRCREVHQKMAFAHGRAQVNFDTRNPRAATKENII